MPRIVGHVGEKAHKVQMGNLKLKVPENSKFKSKDGDGRGPQQGIEPVHCCGEGSPMKNYPG